MADRRGGGEVPGHGEVELAVGQVATRVDDGAGVIVDDEELVGLDRAAPFVAQIGKHQAHMALVTEEFVRHGLSR